MVDNMTGYQSKRAAAQAKVEGPIHVVCQCDKCKEQPAQEPVAWRYDYAKYRENDLRGRQWEFNVFAQARPYIDEMGQNVTPLYTTPPQRPWVDLTDDDIFAVVRHLYATAESAFMGRIDDIATARVIQAALRSKNT
jgi:hypothetical protein